jgi:hypothetical protein
VTATWVSGTQVDLVDLVEKQVDQGTIAATTATSRGPA